MGKEKKAEPVKDVRELNWEETEENSEFGNQNSEISADAAPEGPKGPKGPKGDEFCGPDYKSVMTPEEVRDIFVEIPDGTVEGGQGSDDGCEENSEFGNQNSETEDKSEFGNQKSEKGVCNPLAAEIRKISKIDIGFPIGIVLRDSLDKVDPEIRKDNPVRRWALCDDHCTFVFKDGRKAVINF